MSKDRKFNMFAALNRRGNPLWGTLSITADEAQTKHDKWNPDPTGEGMGESIAQIQIYIKGFNVK